ncbi:MAG: hypothetical protein ACI8V2_000387 [Candidatus Latescibacterota bacterium]|jgi:hypothetical protein
MRTFKSQRIPMIALLLTGVTAFGAESHLPYTHPYVVYRFTAAIVIFYTFFRFIAFADKRRAAQLDEVGLLQPLQDAAFLICTHAHLRELGVRLSWLSPDANVEIGVVSWACILIGYYAPQQPQGLPNLLINQLPFVTPQNKHQFCQGLIVSGCIGVIGTFTPTAQIMWLLLPLTIVLLRAHRAKS